MDDTNKAQVANHALSLLGKSISTELPIVIAGGRELFGDEADTLIMVIGAITTPERFAEFSVSLAHLTEDGRIMRYGKQIGDALLISEKSDNVGNEKHNKETA